jgi:hypothetical protein
MALDALKFNTDSQPLVINQSRVKRVPWNHRNSTWESSYGLPSSPLHVFLSPQKKREMLADLPSEEELKQKYYNESVKLSLVHGCFSPHDIVQRSCRPALDQVKGVFDIDLPAPDIPQTRKKMVRYRGGQDSRSEHNILYCPEVKPPDTAAGVEKIGSRPQRKSQCRRACDISSKIGAASNQANESDEARSSGQHRGSGSTRGVRCGGAGVQYPLGQMDITLQPRQAQPSSAKTFMQHPAIHEAVNLDNVTLVPPKPPPRASEHELATAIAALNLRSAPSQLQEMQTTQELIDWRGSCAQTSQIGEVVVPGASNRGASQRRKTKEAAYMPLVDPKSKLMDYLNTLAPFKTLLPRGLRGMQRLSVNSIRSDVRR